MRGGTRRHGKGWGWFFSAPDSATGKRRFYSRNGFPTKKAAQEALSAELARFHNGAFVEPSKLTVQAFLLEQWLPAVEGRLRPSTRANYQTNLQIHIIPALGALKLQRLTAPRLGVQVGDAVELRLHPVIFNTALAVEAQVLSHRAVRQVADMLGADVVQPGAPLTSGQHQRRPVRTIHHDGFVGRRALLAERIAVVPDGAGVGSGVGRGYC